VDRGSLAGDAAPARLEGGWGRTLPEYRERRQDPQVEFKLPWREAGPPKHHDDKVDSDQEVVDEELSLLGRRPQTEICANLYRETRRKVLTFFFCITLE